METYTDFGVSYLIQTFVNKINTKKLWNDCRVMPQREFQIFRKNILDITSENLLFELKQRCLPSLPRSHDVTVTVGKQVNLHPSTTSGLGTPMLTFAFTVSLVRFFPYWGWIRRFTVYFPAFWKECWDPVLSVLSRNAG